MTDLFATIFSTQTLFLFFGFVRMSPILYSLTSMMRVTKDFASKIVFSRERDDWQFHFARYMYVNLKAEKVKGAGRKLPNFDRCEN
jgi:hypothetical protein